MVRKANTVSSYDYVDHLSGFSRFSMLALSLVIVSLPALVALVGSLLFLAKTYDPVLTMACGCALPSFLEGFVLFSGHVD